jgi:F420H(2)-dependent quinone reductase
MPASPAVPPPGSLRLKALNRLTALNVLVYRRSGGRLGGRIKGAPILLLDHVGRRSGQPRTTPVLYLEHGETLVIVGSRGGSAAPPAWWLNLAERPETTVQVGRKRRSVRARQATPEEHKELWPRLVAMFADYETYQRRTDRPIPVILLEPTG